jgi:hypothetical protein
MQHAPAPNNPPVRVIGILHIAARSKEPHPWATPIAARMVDDVLAIAEYVLPHARAAFAVMGAYPAAAAANMVREWAVRDKLESFSKRDAWRASRGRFFLGRQNGLEWR